MDRCSNLGGVGRLQFLDSCSLSSLLVNINISECNLFNNSFPEDWSNLFSLKLLNISNNHITSLPGCVKSLPSLEVLNANFCPHLQSVLDVPKSVTILRTFQNSSLEIVQLPPSPLSFFFALGSEKLCALEGCCKLESIKTVDSKVIRYLGLESILENGMGPEFDKQNAYTNEDSIKVSYEFGIFSSFVSGKTLPCFRYKEIGSTISFRVPSHPNGSRISGLNVCFISTLNLGRSRNREVEVNNKTKVLVWKYSPTIHVTCNKTDDFYYVWLSLWRTGNLLDDGDEIVVSISEIGGNIVEECCVNFVYDDDEVGEENQEEMDDEKKDSQCMFNHISWNERMRVEISDYVHSGKTYCFTNLHGTDDLIVDWWGLRENWWCRQINAGVPVLI